MKNNASFEDKVLDAKAKGLWTPKMENAMADGTARRASNHPIFPQYIDQLIFHEKQRQGIKEPDVLGNKSGLLIPAAEQHCVHADIGQVLEDGSMTKPVNWSVRVFTKETWLSESPNGVPFWMRLQTMYRDTDGHPLFKPVHIPEDIEEAMKSWESKEDKLTKKKEAKAARDAERNLSIAEQQLAAAKAKAEQFKGTRKSADLGGKNKKKQFS